MADVYQTVSVFKFIVQMLTFGLEVGSFFLQFIDWW